MSSESLINFSERLHFNIALNLLVNLPLIFLILKYSPNSMGFYKYYLLYTVVTAMLMDLHQTIIHGIYILVPILATCCTGLCRQWGYIWGALINFLILEINLSILGFGLLSLIMYRFYIIKSHMMGDSVFFPMESKFSIPGLFIISAIYPTPLLILNIISLENPEKAAESLMNTNPRYAEIIKMSICAATLDWKIGTAYLAATAIQICIIYGAGIYYGIKSVQLLYSLRNTLSKTTYNQQKQLIISVIIQCTVPFVCYMMPISIIMIAIACDFNSTVFPQIMIQTMTLHAPMNGLAIMFTITPYRNAVKKIVFFFLCIKMETPQTSIIPVSFTFSKEN